jgi:hypothetical protein
VVHFTDPDPGQLAAAALPPLPIGAIVAGTADLMNQATGLPQPGYIAISSDQRICLQFTGDRPGARAVSQWAVRFGGVLTSEHCQDQGSCYQLCELRFDYYGVRVAAYALIPAAPGHPHP